MADRTFITINSGQGKETTLLKRYTTVEVVSIDENDTVTLDNYTTVNNAKVINLSNGNDVDVSLATNVITITEVGLSGGHIIILAVGS